MGETTAPATAAQPAARVARAALLTLLTLMTLLALLPDPARAQAPEAAPVPQHVADMASQDLQRLAARLNDANLPQEARDDAARRLLSRQTPAARRILGDALVNLNVGGQLAAARALAEDPQPDPAMINPLFAVLGTNRQLTEAASRALIGFKSNPEVTQRLIAHVQGKPPAEASRLIVIRALGAMPEKRVAEFLVGVVRNPQESVAARATAAEALADLTGLPHIGPDVERWSQWWTQNAAKSEEQFRSDLLARRSARHDRLERRYQSLAAALDTVLREQYRATPAAQRPDLLLKYLRNDEPRTRAVAAGIVYDEALDNRPPTAAVREQLREMIGDSDASVRAAVAEAFAKINDAAASDALLAQLAQETDPNVRASLARAVAPINDLRAVPLLVAMLSDASLTAASAAAEALKSLGPHMRESDPALTRRAALAMRDALEQRTGTPETLAFREDLVEAMAPLRQPELLPLFTRMLDERRGESVEVRRLAIRAIGEIGDQRSAGLLITALEDREPRIRLTAVQALANNPALAENAEALRDLLDPQREADEAVRLAAWRALESVFPVLPKKQLQIWADRFRSDPARRERVLKDLAQQQLRDKDEDDLATTRESIAQVLVDLKDYKQAAEYFRLALDYKKTRPGVPDVVIDSLMRARMQALLLSRDYPAAVAFAAQMIHENAAHAQLFGTLIWNDAQRLSDAGDFQSALDLIAAANAMDPPLSDRYREELASIEKEIQARRSQQNGAPPPPGPRSASANEAGSNPGSTASH